MPDEVRYHMLRPAQIATARKTCPVAYVPIGTIEWHGPHNAVGADTLQAEGLAIHAAQLGGGLVFPPLWYGESRAEALVDADHRTRNAIATELGFDPDRLNPDRQPFSATDQTLNYHKLLIHILAELQSLGFELGVLVAGHYPLIDHARAAATTHNKRNDARWHGMLAWACVDYLLVKDQYDTAGDHGGGWETSHMMHLHPQTVDLDLLPPKGETILGAGGKLDPQDASPDFGRETLEAAAQIVVKEVHHRINHRDQYQGHGMSMVENQWNHDNP